MPSKRVGLEKALYQVEQAVKRLRSGDPRQTVEDEKVVSHLRGLLAGSAKFPNESPGLSSAANSREEEDEDEEEEEEGEENNSYEGRSSIRSNPDIRSTSIPNFVERTEESLAVDDAENPLQLLARASYFQPSEDGRRGGHPTPLQHRMRASSVGRSEEAVRLNEFFSSTKVNLDIGDEVDPIVLGLVTIEESESLLT